MSVCKYCQTPITWVKMGDKNTPMNMDGITIHKCKDSIPQPGIPVSQGINQANQVQQGTNAMYAKPVIKSTFNDTEDRTKKLIVWQSCMKIAIEAIAQVGSFPDNDEQMAHRIAKMTKMLYDESLSVWRTGDILKVIPQQYQEQINKMT